MASAIESTPPLSAPASTSMAKPAAKWWRLGTKKPAAQDTHSKADGAASKGFLSTLQRQIDGIVRWISTDSAAAALKSKSRTTDTSRASTQGNQARSDIISASSFLRFHMHASQKEREELAKSLGMDLNSYMIFAHLQHRDITPEDYDVLRNLDATVKPKTLPIDVIDAYAPTWSIASDEPSSERTNGVLASSETAGDAPLKHCAMSKCSSVLGHGKRNIQGKCTEARRRAPCCICLEPLRPKDICRTLPCAHAFHAACIEHWLSECSDCCPEDSQPIVPPALV
mmetsp:Transcript_28708/g.78407  ORF Transcript_28708/g.78407 Transcript_28708/m.78407 type:complete len:284 (-) Transcript_28708:402-1253(-)